MAQHFPWKNRRFLHYSLQCDFPPVFFLFCIGISQLLPSVPSIFCSKKNIPAKHTLSRRYVWKQSHILLHLIFRECRFFAITFKSISAAASCGPAPCLRINIFASEKHRLLSLYCWSRILFECNAVQREFLQSYGSPAQLLRKDTPYVLC